MFSSDGKVTPRSYGKAVKFMMDSSDIKSGAPWEAVAT